MEVGDGMDGGIITWELGWVAGRWSLIWELSWAVIGGKLTRCARAFLLSYAGVVRLDSLFPQCLTIPLL